MELTNNQAALIIETSDTGEITVNVATPDFDGLSGKVCQAIAMKLMQDRSEERRVGKECLRL